MDCFLCGNSQVVKEEKEGQVEKCTMYMFIMKSAFACSSIFDQRALLSPLGWMRDVLSNHSQRSEFSQIPPWMIVLWAHITLLVTYFASYFDKYICLGYQCNIFFENLSFTSPNMGHIWNYNLAHDTSGVWTTEKTWCSSQTPLLFETPRYFGILEEHGFNQFLNFKALISAGRAVIPEPLIFMLGARDFRPDTHPQSAQRRNVSFGHCPHQGETQKQIVP